MAGSLGTVKGQLILDVKQAIAAYAAVRMANVQTVTAMNRGGAILRRAGVVMGGAGLVMAAGLGVAVKAAAEFERKMDFFGAVTNASTEEMERARQKALELGRDTIYSADQIADSFIELGKSGVKTNEIVDGIGEAVANLGAAADIPLVNASSIIVSAVQTFGLEASKAVDVADKLAGSANESMVEVQDLGVSLKYAGGVAAGLGIPFEDLNTAIAILGKYGIKGSTAGTSLRQMMVGLVGNSGPAIETMKELGIVTDDGANKFFNAAGKLKPLPKVMDILNESMTGLTQEEKIAKLRTMFNVRALPTVLNLMKQGSKGFEEMSAAIDKTSAAEVASKRLDNLSGDMEILRGNIETFLITAGTPFQEFLRTIVQGLTSVIQWFGNLPASVQQGILVFIAITAAALLFMGTISFIAGIVFTFIATMMDLWAALKLIKAGLIAAKASMVALNLAFLTNPVFLVIAAVVALIAVFVILYQKNAAFREFINGIGAAIKAGFLAVVEWFKTLPAFFSGLWTSIQTSTMNAWNAIINFFTVTIPTFFSNAWNTIVTGISSFVSRMVGWFSALPGRIMGFVRNLVNGVINWFAKLPGRVGYFIGYMAGRLVRAWIDMAMAATRTMQNLYNGVVGWFQKLPGRVARFMQNLANNVIRWFTNARSRAIAQTALLYAGVVRWFQQLPGRVAAFVTNLVTRAITGFTNFRSRAIAQTAMLYAGVVRWFQQLPGRVQAFISNLVSGVISRLNNLRSSAVNIAQQMHQGFLNWVRQLPSAANDAVNNAISAFTGMIGRAFNAARSFAGGLWDGFKAGLGINSPSFIEKQMVQITRVVDDETRNLRGQVRQVQGLGSRLTKIPTMSGEGPTVVTSTARRLVDQLAAEAARNQAAINELRAMTADTTTQSARWTAQRLDSVAQTPSLSATPTMRISPDQMEELGERSITVEMTNYNPVEEKSSQTAVREMTRLSQLEVL